MGTYASEVLADAPIGYWPLTDGADASWSGAVSDLSGHAYTGSTVGLIAPLQRFPNADTGMRFFGATGAGVTVPDNNALSPSRFSLEAIISAYSNDGSTRPIIIKYKQNVSYPEYGLVISPSNQLLVYFYTSSSSTAVKQCVGPSTLIGAGPKHVVGTYDGATLKLYIDGELVASAAATGSPYNSAALFGIGRADYSGTSPASFIGLISNAALYGAALSAERIAAHYAAYERSITGVVERGSPVAPVQRKVLLFTPTGDLAGAATSDAVSGAYSIETAASKALYGIAFEDYGSAWAATTAYAIAARAFPTVPNGHWYQVETAGTSGGAESTWPTDGSTVTDGTVVWRDKGAMEEPIARGPYVIPAA